MKHIKVQKIILIAVLFSIGSCQLVSRSWIKDPEYIKHQAEAARLEDRVKFLEDHLNELENRPSAISTALQTSGAMLDMGSGVGKIGRLGAGLLAGQSSGVVAGLRPVSQEQMKARVHQVKKEIEKAKKQLTQHRSEMARIQEKYSAVLPPVIPVGKDQNTLQPIMPKKPLSDNKSDRGGKEYSTNPSSSHSSLQ